MANRFQLLGIDNDTDDSNDTENEDEEAGAGLFETMAAARTTA